MKVLAAGDIHGDTELARELAAKADREKVDLVILCGDITDRERSTDNLVGAFKQKVLLIPGNHESIATADFLAERYHAKNLHGYSVKIKDIGFFGCGLANIGISQLTDKDVAGLLRKGYSYVKDCKKKIMVTHVHPSGTIMEKLTRFFPGSTGVKQAAEDLKPDILFCSHVHEAEGIEEIVGKTRVINVGRKGKIVEI